MRSIERRFKNISNKYPELSTYICFVKTVRHQEFTREIIRDWFIRLVQKDDYQPEDLNSLIGQLYELSNTAEEPEFRPEIGSGGS